MAVEWITPKTNWTASDRFNMVDYNRIRGNLLVLQDMANVLNPPERDSPVMGAVDDYRDLLHADMLNAIEVALESVNGQTLHLDIGVRVSFYDNGRSIDYVELNRIESAILLLYNNLKHQYEGRRMLTFMLGITEVFNGVDFIKN